MICSKPLILQVGKRRPREERGPTEDTERGRSIAEIQPQNSLISKPRFSALVGGSAEQWGRVPESRRVSSHLGSTIYDPQARCLTLWTSVSSSSSEGKNGT